MKDVDILCIAIVMFVFITLFIINMYRLFLFKGEYVATHDQAAVSKPDLTSFVDTQKFETIQPKPTNHLNNVPMLRRFQDVSEENSLNIARIENEVDDLTEKLHQLQQQLNSINYDVDQ